MTNFLSRLDRLSGLIAPVAFMGAPTIAVEMVCSGKEVEIGLSTQQKLLNAGNTDFSRSLYQELI